jgi:putative FmdB family regulatory protein
MPLYNYICPKCDNHETDVLIKWSDKHACSECGAESTRQLSAPGLAVFKGGAPFSASSAAGKTWSHAEYQGKTIWSEKVAEPKKFQATEAEKSYIESIKP